MVADSLRLVVDEEDLAGEDYAHLKASRTGGEMLGARDTGKRLMDAAIKATLARATTIAAEAGDVTEITISLEVACVMFDAGLTGTISLTVVPHKDV